MNVGSCPLPHPYRHLLTWGLYVVVAPVEISAYTLTTSTLTGK